MSLCVLRQVNQMRGEFRQEHIRHCCQDERPCPLGSLPMAVVDAPQVVNETKQRAAKAQKAKNQLEFDALVAEMNRERRSAANGD